VLFLAAWVLTRIVGKRSPGHAHAVWALTLLGLLALPLLWLALPPVRFTPELSSSTGAPLLQAVSPLLAQDRMLGLTNTSGGYIALSRQAAPGAASLAAHLLGWIWAFGTLAALSRLLLGCRIAWRISAGPMLPITKGLLEEIRRKLSIRRAVAVVTSPRCGVPFTCGLLHPRIVLPDEASRWKESRMEAVLLHELAHVKRNDSLLNFLAGVVTSLLWCVPLSWIVVSLMRREREKCADRMVLAHGVPGAVYASELLELVRRAPGHLLIPGLQSSFGRKSMLRERIRCVLDAGSRRAAKPLRLAGMVPVAVFCSLLTLLAVTCASVPRTGAGVEKLHGKWMNKEYFGSYWTHTFVMYPGGREIWFTRTDLDSPTGEGRFAIDKAWVDAEGNGWYNITWRDSYMPYNEDVANASKSYSLVKLTPAGDFMEIESSAMTWPEKFGSLGSHHYVYYKL
jgi:beta-lactamase regulating signal transducer with metallopeptidase domain